MRLQFRMAHPNQLRAADLVQNFATKRCWKKHPRQPEIPIASPEVPPESPMVGEILGEILGGILWGDVPSSMSPVASSPSAASLSRLEMLEISLGWFLVGFPHGWDHVIMFFWKTTTCWDHVSGPFFSNTDDVKQHGTSFTPSRESTIHHLYINPFVVKRGWFCHAWHSQTWLKGRSARTHGQLDFAMVSGPKFPLDGKQSNDYHMLLYNEWSLFHDTSMFRGNHNFPLVPSPDRDFWVWFLVFK